VPDEELRVIAAGHPVAVFGPHELKDAREFVRQWNYKLPEPLFQLFHARGEFPPCCTCNPATCGATDDACLDAGCDVCVHGCPAIVGQPCCQVST
jgi:hypothetical protein